METPTIISNHQFPDLDLVNLVLDAIIADNIITIEEYRLLQSEFKSLYPKLIQQSAPEPTLPKPPPPPPAYLRCRCQ